MWWYINYHIFQSRLRLNKEITKLELTNPEFLKYKLENKVPTYGNAKRDVTPFYVLINFHRAIGDLGYRLPQLRRTARNAQDNLQLRIQYSVKEITREQFEKQ